MHPRGPAFYAAIIAAAATGGMANAKPVVGNSALSACVQQEFPGSVLATDEKGKLVARTIVTGSTGIVVTDIGLQDKTVTIATSAGGPVRVTALLPESVTKVAKAAACLQGGG